MNEEYKRENHRSYLVLKMEDLPKEAGYGVRMMCENSVEGFLPMSVQMFNGESELCYDISSKQSFRLFYEKSMLQKEDLEKLFTSLRKALQSLDNYLLETEPLVLDTSYIYVGGSGDEVFFLYAPAETEDFEEKVYEFAEYILEKINHEDEDAVMYGYSFYRYIKEEKGDLSTALEKLFDALKPQEKEESASSYRKDVDDIEEISDYAAIEQNNLPIEQDEEKSPYLKVMRTSFFAVLGLSGLGMVIYNAWNYGLSFATLFSEAESVIGVGICAVAIGGLVVFWILDRLAEKEENMKENEAENRTATESGHADEYVEIVNNTRDEEDYATVLLQENCYTEQRILIGRVKGRKRQIDLSTFPFVVGKNKDHVDYTLEDASVSRVHARFTLREDVVYLTDLNSTNGTRRNGVLLEPNELVMLEADDEITFGRLTFTYH